MLSEKKKTQKKTANPQKVTYCIILPIYRTFLNDKLQKWRPDWCSYNRATPGIPVVMELFCVLTVVMDTGTYTCDKHAEN